MSPAQHPRTPLSSVDAGWLHMDVPTNPMVITVALMFEAPLDFKLVRELVAQRLLPYPRFAQRVGERQGSAPHWEDDPRFSLEAHVHRIGLPGAGDDATLRELLSDLASTPLDPTRPLWQVYLIEHYGQGCVLALRIHHCLADGVTLVQVFNNLFDPSSAKEIVPVRPSEELGVIDNAFEALGAVMRSTETLVQEGWSWVSRPTRIFGLLGQGAAVLGKIALMGPDAPSVFKGPLSVTKRVAWSEPVPLTEVKAIGKVLGGTINDVLLTAVAGALRRYLEQRGAPVSTRGLRAMVPVNLLPPGAKSDGGNHFGLVYLTLPLAVEDQVERIARLRKEMDAIKASPEAHIAYGIVGLLGTLPTRIERTVIEALCNMASLVVTNVPGSRIANTLAGQPVRRAMFWVPEAAGISLGISILSYAEEVQVGVLADANLVPDPERLAAAFDAEMADLIAIEREAAG